MGKAKIDVIISRSRALATALLGDRLLFGDIGIVVGLINSPRQAGNAV